MLTLPDYPAQIQAQLRHLSEQLLLLKPRSIVLLGSAARGELVYRLGEQPELFSDYELMVVWENAVRASDKAAIKRIAADFEHTVNNANPLFHVDMLARSVGRLATVRPTIFTYEMKSNGWLLYGEPIAELLPTINLNTLDLRNANEILFKRLWAIMLHLPRKFLTGGMNSAEIRMAGYVLCRNALDISTVLMPHHGILLPTYQQRISHLQQHPSLLGATTTTFLADCLYRRDKLEFEHCDLRTLYQQTIEYLNQAIATLLPAPLPYGAHAIFNEKPISRAEWLNLARQTVRQVRSHGANATMRWLRAPRKGLLALGLLEAHQALCTHWQGDTAGAQAKLVQSQQRLAQLGQPTTIDNASFANRWLALRQAWGEVWRVNIRLNDPAYIQRFHNIMSWEASR